MSTIFYIAGVDEVGRGPLAGPVVAAAVILDTNVTIDGIRDSKKLTAKKRESLAIEIKAKAIAWAIGRAEVEEIDSINILQASLLAMRRACEKLSIQPHHIVVDGNQLPKWDYSSEAIIGGDDSHTAIGAASIIAKVARDQEMAEWNEIYPGYGFAQHVGYGTRQHLTALKELGICPIHRRSFAPIKLYAAEHF